MFKKQTTFLLGAGASWHYGYPTGEELVPLVVQNAGKLADYFKGAFDRGLPAQYSKYVLRHQKSTEGYGTIFWQRAEEEARALELRVKNVNPILIDHFLAQNAGLQDVGRLAITMAILDCERIYQAAVWGNANRRYLAERNARMVGNRNALNSIDLHAFNDDWLRFVLYRITSNCETSADLLQRNNVSFVTFNYDTSLEHRLYEGLRNIELFCKEDVLTFLSKERFIHVYGAIRTENRFAVGDLATDLNPRNTEYSEIILDKLFAASAGIRTIDGPPKAKDNAELELAAKNLRDAAEVIILGYGFDQLNNARLQLPLLRPGAGASKTVYFTNYGGHNRVGTSAGQALVGDPAIFLPSNPPIFIGQAGHRHNRYEMSVKDVYSALSEDFATDV